MSPPAARSGRLRAAATALAAALLAVACDGAVEAPGGEGLECATVESVEEPHGDRPGEPDLPGIASHDPGLVEHLREEAAAQPPEVAARAKHRREDGRPAWNNRLLCESSPYLLQHAHNPVNWHAWGDAAFEKARREDKPVFLSIGYSTCHWCHVMEGECFEDEEIAAFLNSRFIAVKVDREERPDVDDTYMAAVQAMTGSGGWPLTLVVTPDRTPFFGATYLPARDGDRGARKGLLSVLAELDRIWKNDRAAATARGEELATAIRDAANAPLAGELPGLDAVDRATTVLLAVLDEEHGGFGRAPKFPRTPSLELLLRRARRLGDPEALRAVTLTLAKMAAGGVRDQVGGGFHRYSVDARWMVPHFEKMLYDNAALASVHLDAFQATGDPRFADVATGILDEVARDFTADDGVFFSANDADSEVPGSGSQDPAQRGPAMEEGRFYTWTSAEFDEAVGPGLAPLARRWLGIDDPVALEGRLVLHAPHDAAEEAERLGIGRDELDRRLADIRARLRDARSKRPAPLRDDKILAAWNGLMISAFAKAARVLDRDDYLERARVAATWFFHHAGDLRRTWNPSRAASGAPRREPGQPAFLDDYAALVAAFLDLFEADPRPLWIDAALRFQDAQDALFLDRERGGYFATAAHHAEILAREKPFQDGAEASGNALSAISNLRLAALTTDDSRRRRAEDLLKAFGRPLERGQASMSKMLGALETALDTMLEVIVVADRADDPALAPLLEVLRRTWTPNRVLVVSTDPAQRPALQGFVPLLEDKAARDGRATAYVCRRRVCLEPTSDPARLAAQLAPPAAAGAAAPRSASISIPAPVETQPPPASGPPESAR